MDVRCEKCQTEYELDESRLKPGGVTVKCTNCGHMFKIRKRTPTNVGLPAVGSDAARQRPISSKPPPLDEAPTHRVGARPIDEAPTTRAAPNRADSVLGDGTPAAIGEQGSGPHGERQWLVRLENGEQKMCRELATLQQWIVAGVATRESLISRSGKTWKRLGDIPELSQYFSIADEARTQRAAKPTPKPASPAATMLGVGGGPKASAAGGTILPDDELEGRTTGNFRSRPRTTPPPPPPPRATTPPKGAEINPLSQTELAPTTAPGMRQAPAVPPGRATAAWASGDIKASESMAAMPQGPRGGKVSSIPDNEPAFAGRVRIEPGAESSFQTGRVMRVSDDDDDMMQPQRGSRAGTWIALLALLVIAGGAGAVYLLVFNKKKDSVAQTPKDAAVVAMVADAAPIVTPIDAAPAPPVDPLDGARTELVAGIEPRMKGVYDSLAGKDDGPSLAMRARLGTALAQSMLERAGLATDKAESDKLRKDSKQLVIDAAPLAQKALKVAADDASANLAMAEVLRLQQKQLKDVQRYLDTAAGKAGTDRELARSIAIAKALTLVRDAKLDDAQKTLAALDGAGDTRVGLELALVAYAQGKPADAKPLVDQILAGAPDHDVARLLSKRLETMVAKTDPLPPEDGHGSAHHDGGTQQVSNGGGGGDYDSLVTKAGKLAESNCGKAMDLYGKALEQKPTGVEALTGMGYCYLDSKQFSSAFSKFRSALAVSNRYEPALAGVAETYQQQGNKDQAIESWRKYLDAYPGSAKAKKQLEILGASPEGGGSAAPTPTPTPTPTPAPAQGSGSAS
jgi:predicted Zn finger-like uncharacterized protein